MHHHLPERVGYILHERAQHYHGAGTGWLSIKTFSTDGALYYVGRNRYAPGKRSYLVLNHGQPYTIQIDAAQPLESFCLFFAPGFAEQVQHSLTQTVDHLLVAPPDAQTPVMAFFERTYPHDTLLSPALHHLQQACSQQSEQGWLIEQFHTIMERLLLVQHGVRAEAHALPAMRVATREEIYRRLCQAKDYADALFASPITVHDMAHVAGLSVNHLLRTFKQAFHQSPYQYITMRRLEHAQHLLHTTDQSVTEICFAVGFESLGAFSWLFRRRIGVSPQRYRQQMR